MDQQAYRVCSAGNKWRWERLQSSSCSFIFTQISCVKSIGSEFQSISFISMVLARGHYEKCHIGKVQSRNPEAVSSWDGCIFSPSSPAACQPRSHTGILSKGFTKRISLLYQPLATRYLTKFVACASCHGENDFCSAWPVWSLCPALCPMYIPITTGISSNFFLQGKPKMAKSSCSPSSWKDSGEQLWNWTIFEPFLCCC